MSTFQNVSGGTLWIQGFLRNGENGTMGVGAETYVSPGSTFTGSNYFKRFTYTGMIAVGMSAERAADEAILLVTVDDGLPFTDTAINVPNNPKVYHETIAAGASVILDFETDLGGPALFTTLETDEAVSVYLNGATNARVDVAANSTVSLNVNELLLDSITISNLISGSSPATVQVIAANIS